MTVSFKNHKAVDRKFFVGQAKIIFRRTMQGPKVPVFIVSSVVSPTLQLAITSKPVLCFRGKLYIHPYAEHTTDNKEASYLKPN